MNAQQTIPATTNLWTIWSTWVALALWIAAIALGWVWLQRYDFAVNAPLPQGIVEQWPANSAIARQPGRPTVVLFMHPRCPCTRATLGELERMYTNIAGAAPVAPDTIIVSTVPADADDAWLSTVTIERAQQLPEARLFVDRDGHEAARFGATTSGTVMVFDAAGHRQFAGGVTASRAHEGDNAGRDAVTQVLQGETSQLRELPAFGCRLCLPEEIDSLNPNPQDRANQTAHATNQ
jgi:hypothetical protein